MLEMQIRRPYLRPTELEIEGELSNLHFNKPSRDSDAH